MLPTKQLVPPLLLVVLIGAAAWVAVRVSESLYLERRAKAALVSARNELQRISVAIEKYPDRQVNDSHVSDLAFYIDRAKGLCANGRGDEMAASRLATGAMYVATYKRHVNFFRLAAGARPDAQHNKNVQESREGIRRALFMTERFFSSPE